MLRTIIQPASTKTWTERPRELYHGVNVKFDDYKVIIYLRSKVPIKYHSIREKGKN